MNKNIKHITVLIIVIIAINFLGSKIFKRFDLTADNRYTLSESAINIVKDIESPVIVDIFLSGNDFPSEFRRLQKETNQLLEEFSAENSHIIFNFINPLEDESTRERNIQQLTQRGLTPMQLSVQESGKATQAVIFPWALASYNDQTVIIPLIKNKIGATQQELVSNSVQHLEYAFSDGFSKLTTPKRRKIAILKGNNQLEDKYIADFVKKLGEYYFIAPFTLDSVASNPQKTLKDIKAYDLIISAKPTEAFTEKEKLVLDQFTMNGGKSLWLIDAVAMEKDSLYNDTGRSFAVTRDLNLTDFFFKYGVRINPVIVSTLYSAPITLAMGEGSQSQFQHLRWPYSPLANSNSNHPIVNNLNLVKLDFANQIDTLKNNINKTILLETAPLTKLEGMPREISLDLVTQEPDPTLFNKGNQTLAVLLEGEFTSVYNNRIKAFKLLEEKNKSIPTKMIVIADGDIIKNNVIKNRPQELGFDRWTGKTYGNKEFLLNAVNYLLDDNGLINIRSKEIAIAFLNHQKIAAQKSKWQLINIALPLVLLAFFGLGFNYFRKKRHAS
ncbi:gliding motility-associated ABC transporter substrate-binding protein GldG [Flavivirga rizhaonensis]|uniref:Gliding motility-associated ABC transporter substrate-binding protein GldG n=1 Tax=Flavivirga rizhaonensis TaxID=2559571 RepID=A0A4S1DW30_9FLAO|nr:gliding motility-associated ABC transporter substrate-binding protein GldG [Flavivirga rizhaonensis]TGV01652.1 gliding motility-associated ABC transporter substrate-binding protein GldG [Flavivirga rizhaonensis]